MYKKNRQVRVPNFNKYTNKPTGTSKFRTAQATPGPEGETPLRRQMATLFTEKLFSGHFVFFLGVLLSNLNVPCYVAVTLLNIGHGPEVFASV